jgi:adenylate cyclase
VSAVLTPQEFADLVGSSIEEVERWRSVGLVDPERLGHYEELDLVRWLRIRQYESQGYRPDQLAAAIATGDVHPYLGEYLFPPSPRVTPREAAQRVGMTVEQARAIRAALGFGGEAIPESWLDQLAVFQTIGKAGLPWDAVLEGARAYGDMLRRLAESEVRLVHVQIHERLSTDGQSDQEVNRQILAIQDAVLPLLDGLVQATHHEHLLQASIEDAYLHLPASETPAERGSVSTTIVFLDVASFTELAEARGDETASELLARLDSVVRALALQNGGKLVKEIGDGLMFAFRDAGNAVVFAREVLGQTDADRAIPPLHVGIHTGHAIYRSGDYIGTTVNLAERVCAASSPGDILLTEAVVAQLADSDAAEPVGVRLLRGSERPLALYRLIRGGAHRDPVCGVMVQQAPAARLRHEAEDVWFCSESCLRRFLERPDAETSALTPAPPP